VFAEWLNQTDAKALNTYDTVIEEDGRSFVRHYLLDFGSALGSDALYPKDPRLGHEYMIEGKAAARNLGSLGLYIPLYARVSYPDDPAVGNFEARAFDPERWKPNYPNAAFESRLPGDEYWGAKKVVAFTDEDIRSIVRTGNYSVPESAETIARVLIARRNKIAQALLPKLLALENFRIDGRRLKFDDLATTYAGHPAIDYSVQWNTFDNASGVLTPIAVRPSDEMPPQLASAPQGSYCAAVIRNGDVNKSVTVYFRRAEIWKVVGIEREGANRWEPRA
jgi:hypothetical protein